MKYQISMRVLMCLAVAVCLAATGAKAQPPVFTFEEPEDLDPWLIQSTWPLTRSSFGATDGNSALLLDNLTSGFKNNVATTPANWGPATPGLTEQFNAFALAASVIASGGTPKLEFDLTWDFSAATDGYIQLGLFVNSSAGFKGYGTSAFINGSSGFASWPALGTASANDGTTLTLTSPNSAHLAVPIGTGKTLTLASPSTFYDIGFQSQGNWGGTVDIAIDNIKFTGVPIFEEHTLFSWETPDDPGTTGVNEQLEGWVPAQTPSTQNISITTIGATHGSSALEVDRTPLQSGFTWGSAFALDATTNPSDQTRIDDLVARINGATQIAIDVTFENQFPISPSYTHLSLAFVDESGAYFQASAPSFDIAEADMGPITQTVIFDIADFDDFNSPKNLAVEGLLEGTAQLGIILGTGSDDGPVFQIDNFRLISEVADGQPGDFDEDGDVDGRDFLAWQRGESPNGTPGVAVSAEDLAEWQNAYGSGDPLTAIGSVPEPAALSLVAITMLTLLARRQQF